MAVDSNSIADNIERLVTKMRETAYDEGRKAEAADWEEVTFTIELLADDEDIMLRIWSPEDDRESFAEMCLSDLVSKEMGYFDQVPLGDDAEYDAQMARQATVYADAFEAAAKQFREVAAARAGTAYAGSSKPPFPNVELAIPLA